MSLNTSIKKGIFTSALLCLALNSFAQRPHSAEKQAVFDKAVADAMVSIKPTAKAKKARKVLVLSKAKGWYHSSIETGKTCMRLMAKQSGAFTADFNDDPKFYTPENLAQYDALVFNNTTHSQELFNTEQREAILGFIKNGGGFFGIHSAADCGTSVGKSKKTWPEITEMIGGAFDGHPWTHKGMYGIRNEDPNHPLVAPLEGKNFKISDEIYKHKDYKRENQRVLWSIDMLESYKPKGRKDHDHAVLWVKNYGKGRVFFSALGHNESVFANEKILQVWLNGLQFAMGDIDVDVSALPQPEIHKNFQPKK